MSTGRGRLRQDLAVTPVAVLTLLLLQLHTNCLFTHTCSTLTGYKMLLFLSLLTSDFPQAGKPLLKSQCWDICQNSVGKTSLDLLRPGSLDLWGLLPAQVLHKATPVPPNSDLWKKMPFGTGNPDFFHWKSKQNFSFEVMFNGIFFLPLLSEMTNSLITLS